MGVGFCPKKTSGTTARPTKPYDFLSRHASDIVNDTALRPTDEGEAEPAGLNGQYVDRNFKGADGHAANPLIVPMELRGVEPRTS